MSIPNRTVSITGVFAEDASTTIPETPVSGASYRNTAMTGTAIREGWAYKTIVDSANFNQALYEYSSVTAQVEKYGFLPWSNLTDYVQGSVCLGSNGKIYQAKQATGPSSTAYDPTTTPTVWDPVVLGVTEFLFHHIWTDYQLNRQDWLRADTFSWQDGTVYTNAYNHLVDDNTGGTAGTDVINGITIYYVSGSDGHKIVLTDGDQTYRTQAVEALYNATGVAWYYILDTTNQRFKLPRTKYGFTGLRDSVGKYVAPGLPDHNHYYDALANHGYNGSAVSQGFWGNGDAYTGSTVRGTFSNASSSNSIYGNSTTVQPPATQMYLYFYVGQFSQSATEQTAGLNTELFNGKVDLDAGNLSTQGKSLISGLGMPSSRYTDLTLLASGQTYTAPANGYVAFAKYATGENQYIRIQCNEFVSFVWAHVASINIFTWMPVKKGDIYTVTYTAPRTHTDNYFRFIYAQGSESEAS